jgi:hypothetical protein
MYALSLECVVRWGAYHNRWGPETVAIHCPFCGQLATFTLTDHALDDRRNTMAASGMCPGCGKVVRFWLVDPNIAQQGGLKCQEFCIYPTPSLNRTPMKGMDKTPPDIRRAYASAVAVFNAGVWTATAVCCRRVLEGIVKNLQREDSQSGPLSQQLENLKTSVDLTKPLTSLADALRKGGNLGAHFDDLEREPDQATASRMVDFLEYLMDYLYVLPAEVESFHNTIARQNRDTNPSATPASACTG